MHAFTVRRRRINSDVENLLCVIENMKGDIRELKETLTVTESKIHSSEEQGHEDDMGLNNELVILTERCKSYEEEKDRISLTNCQTWN